MNKNITRSLNKIDKLLDKKYITASEIIFIKKEIRDILSNSSTSLKPISTPKPVKTNISGESRFWKYCSNDKFIRCIEETLYKCPKKNKSPDDELEKFITKDVLDLSSDEYDKYTSFKNYQKSIQNEIGNFNQFILGCCDGWKSNISGIDLVNKERGICIEVKNRYNTLNSSSKKHTLEKLEKESNKYKCYLAHIIPKKHSYPEKHIPKYNVSELCGDYLYELVTGDKSSREELFSAVKKYSKYRKIKMI